MPYYNQVEMTKSQLYLLSNLMCLMLLQRNVDWNVFVYDFVSPK